MGRVRKEKGKHDTDGWVWVDEKVLMKCECFENGDE